MRNFALFLVFATALTIPAIAQTVNWIEPLPPNAPAARWVHEMVYDSSRSKVVVFGGEGNGNYLGDTWEEHR